MNRLICKYCHKPTRFLFHGAIRGSWCKCETCDVSYRININGNLVRQHIYLRMENKTYRFLIDYFNGTSVLFFRASNPLVQEWQWTRIVEFSHLVEYSPQQLREKLPLLLVFS